jgi:hypothetical protein
MYKPAHYVVHGEQTPAATDPVPVGSSTDELQGVNCFAGAAGQPTSALSVPQQHADAGVTIGLSGAGGNVLLSALPAETVQSHDTRRRHQRFPRQQSRSIRRVKVLNLRWHVTRAFLFHE